MRVLVLGVGGMLGHKMYQRLGTAPGVERFATLRAVRSDMPYARIPWLQDTAQVFDRVDAMDWPRLEALLTRLRPQVVINCIGVIKQRAEAKAPVPSITLNALLPHRLLETVSTWTGRVIHISTDCVFSGSRGGYREADLSDADDLYGRTKYLGELTAGPGLTLRTSLIGRELTGHRSLLDWFLRQRGRTIQGYTRAIYSGVTTVYLADLIVRLITEYSQLHGLFHVASTPISKFELLHLVADAFDVDVRIDAHDAIHCDRSLDGSRFDQAVGFRCPPWPELIGALRADPTPYADWIEVDANLSR
jgi:dTDP-4-dehydrorhamnose reductase